MAVEQQKQNALIFWALAAALTVAAFALRTAHIDNTRIAGAVHFSDVDTMRRLARIRTLDALDEYPVVEVRDGFPEGTVSHWTKPFDWCLKLLDPLAAPFVAHAKDLEAAAVLAGPILGTLSVILFLFFAVRLLGRYPGLLAAAFYALQYPLLHMQAAGNGDHQNLQHLFLLGFLGLWLLESAEKAGRFAAPLSGIALGLSIWVSTESTVVFLGFVAVSGCLVAFAPAAEIRTRATRELARCGALWITLLIAASVEQASIFGVEWDKVSWFQLYPVSVFVLFLGLARLLPEMRGRGPIAAAAGLGIGLVGLFALPGFHATVQAQLAEFDHVNVWLQTAVAEFRSSFFDGQEYTVSEAMRRFTPFLLGFPVFLAGCWIARGIPWRGRAVLIATALLALGLAGWEVKLGHVFAILFPLVLVLGCAALRDRFLPEAGPSRTIGALVLLALLGWSGLAGRPSGSVPPDDLHESGVRELCAFLNGKKGAETSAVLAPWDKAGAILYHTQWPVVASGYHRNIAGIEDGYRFFLGQPEEKQAIDALLARRKVRYVVAWANRLFFRDAQIVLGTEKEFVRIGGGSIQFLDPAARSLYWQMRYAKSVPGYRLVYASRDRVGTTQADVQPLFKIYEVIPR